VAILQMRLGKCEDINKVITGLEEHAKEFNRTNYAVAASLLTPSLALIVSRYESLETSQKHKSENSGLQEKVGKFEIIDNGYWTPNFTNDANRKIKSNYLVMMELELVIGSESETSSLAKAWFEKYGEQLAEHNIQTWNLRKIAGIGINKLRVGHVFPTLSQAEKFLAMGELPIKESEASLHKELNNKFRNYVKNVSRGIFEIKTHFAE